jgi:hypothetical protein
MVEAAGVELGKVIENTQLTDSVNAAIAMKFKKSDHPYEFRTKIFQNSQSSNFFLLFHRAQHSEVLKIFYIVRLDQWCGLDTLSSPIFMWADRLRSRTLHVFLEGRGEGGRPKSADFERQRLESILLRSRRSWDIS